MTDQAKQQAGQAKEQAKQVAGTAADEGKQLLGEAKAQARNLVGELRTTVEDQSRTQRDSLVGLLRSVSDDLDEMASQRSDGQAAEIVRQVSQHARSLSESMDGREPQELLEDLRAMARRRPGMFLLGSLAAGVVAGRLLRGAKDASSSGTSGYGYSGYGSTYPTSAGMSQTYPTTGMGTSGVGTGTIAGDPLTDPMPGSTVESDLGRPTGSGTGSLT